MGILFAVGGAAIDAASPVPTTSRSSSAGSGASTATTSGAPRFTLAWLLFFALGVPSRRHGVDPIMVTELSVIFWVVALPLTYLPILLVANDRAYMGATRTAAWRTSSAASTWSSCS